MRRSFFAFVFTMTLILAGCSSSPAPETAKEEAPEAAPAAATEPASAPATETAPAGTETAKAGETPAPAAAPVAVTTEEEKTIYALGLAMGKQLGDFHLSAKELDIVKRALTDNAANKPLVSYDTYGPKLNDLARSRATAGAAIEKTKGKEYAAKIAKMPGAKMTPSGMVYRELKAGTGAVAKVSDMIRITYKGTFLDGSEFDSSFKTGKPAEFPLGNLVQCWQEGIPMMKVGGKAQLVCPSDIAYGDSGRGNIPGGATLLFEIELLGIL